MRKISFAVLGFGFIGKKHAYFIEQNEMATLSATIDPEVKEAGYSSLVEFIKDDRGKTDVIVIATPNSLHATQAMQCIDAGYHVVVEKPLALHTSEAQQLKITANNHQKKVFVVMQNRYSPVASWLKNIVLNGSLGKLYSVQVNCLWNRDERYYKAGSWHGSKSQDGGSIYTQFSHFVDLIYWLFGSFKTEFAKFYNFNHRNITQIEDSGSVQLVFNNGGIGQFNFSTSCYHTNLESTLTILAENGTIKVGGQYMDQVLHCSIKDYHFEGLEEITETFGNYKGNGANHRHLIQNVVETLNLRSKEHTNLEEGIEVVRLIEEMYAST